jgi:parallel beta-helix repeat protein
MRLVFFVALLAAGAARAETFHVAPGGDDADLGSEGEPWATLQKAADTVRAGDTVLVREGSYRGFDLRRSGEPGRPITFAAASPGTARITQDNPRTPDGINVEGLQDAPVTDVVLDGFVVNDRSRAGVRLIWCHRCTARRITADSNFRWGILTGFSSDLLLEDNVCSRSEDEHGIYVSNSGDRPRVRRNVLFSNRANGLHMNGDLATPCDEPTGGPECDGIITGAEVEANVIYDNGAGGGSGINGDGVRDSLIRNNLIHESHASGISLYRIDGGGASMGNRVLHNTVIVAADGRWALNLQDGATGTRVANNILLSRHGTRGSIDLSADSAPGLLSDHNVVEDRFSVADVFVGLSQWRTMTGQDGASIVATEAELFAGGTDFRLREGSPAIGKADPAQAPETDLEGRVRDGAPDIGAYEAGGGPAPADGGAVPLPDASLGGADAGAAAAGDAGRCGCRTAEGVGDWMGLFCAAALLVFRSIEGKVGVARRRRRARASAGGKG